MLTLKKSVYDILLFKNTLNTLAGLNLHLGAQSMSEALEKQVSARGTFKGRLDTYRFCDNVRPIPETQQDSNEISEHRPQPLMP